MMIMGINKILARTYIFILIQLLFTIISNTDTLSAQNRDFQLWTGAAIEAEPFKNISLEIEEELRLKNNAGDIESYFTDIGLSVDIWKGFTIGGYYRFVMKNEEERYSKIHRYHFDLSYGRKLGRFELSARTRYQIRYEDVYTSENGHLPEKYSRNKLRVSYDIYRTSLEPRLWFEIYYQLNNPEGNCIDKIRIAPELRYTIKSSNEIKIFYMIEKEYRVSDPALIFVLGVGYAYKI